MTSGEALKAIKKLVEAGSWKIGVHVFRDHPERNTNPAEVKVSILGSWTIEATGERWKVTGPSLRPPAKIVSIIALDTDRAFVVTAWRIPR